MNYSLYDYYSSLTLQVVMKSENVTALHPQHSELTKEIGDLMIGEPTTEGLVNHEEKKRNESCKISEKFFDFLYKFDIPCVFFL